MRTLEQLGISKTPWSVETTEICNYVNAADGTMVADVGRYGSAEADARLIAAAPELYKCLREAAIDYCWDCDSNENGMCENVMGSCLIQKWRDALAAASGESEVRDE